MSKEEDTNRLKLLEAEKFDVEEFKLIRNQVISKAIIDKYVDDLVWEGSYTKEDVPQHWLYYYLIVLKAKNPEAYTRGTKKLKVTEVDIHNDEAHKKKRLPFSTEELFNILVETYMSLSTVKLTTDIGIKLREAQKNLFLQRQKEINLLRHKLE